VVGDEHDRRLLGGHRDGAGRLAEREHERRHREQGERGREGGGATTGVVPSTARSVATPV
jgi:hypothetical protein